MAVRPAGCALDDSENAEETGTTEGAKVIDPASMDGAKGEVT